MGRNRPKKTPAKNKVAKRGRKLANRMKDLDQIQGDMKTGVRVVPQGAISALIFSITSDSLRADTELLVCLYHAIAVCENLWCSHCSFLTWTKKPSENYAF